MLSLEARIETGSKLIEMSLEMQRPLQLPQLNTIAISEDGENGPREATLKSKLPSSTSFELRWTNLNYIISQRKMAFSWNSCRLPKRTLKTYVILQNLSGVRTELCAVAGRLMCTFASSSIGFEGGAI